MLYIDAPRRNDENVAWNLDTHAYTQHTHLAADVWPYVRGHAPGHSLFSLSFRSRFHRAPSTRWNKELRPLGPLTLVAPGWSANKSNKNEMHSTELKRQSRARCSLSFRTNAYTNYECVYGMFNSLRREMWEWKKSLWQEIGDGGLMPANHRCSESRLNGKGRNRNAMTPMGSSSDTCL